MRDCKEKPKQKEQGEANFVDTIVQIDSTGVDMDWWIDTGVSCHVCLKKELFTICKHVSEKVMMTNQTQLKYWESGRWYYN